MTLRRLMLEVAFAAVLMAPAGFVSRLPASGAEKVYVWSAALGWSAMLLLMRRAYRGMPNPFG